MSVGQDIQGNLMFPEDTYETGQYQEDGPKPEDKVYNTTVLVEVLFIETPLVIFRQFKTLNSNNFQGCALAEPGGPWRLAFAPGQLENLRFFIQIICWAP